MKLYVRLILILSSAIGFTGLSLFSALGQFSKVFGLRDVLSPSRPPSLLPSPPPSSSPSIPPSSSPSHPPLPLCTCQETWTDTPIGCMVPQSGCPVMPCDNWHERWCLVETSPCVGEGDGGEWFACGDTPLMITRHGADYNNASITHVIDLAISDDSTFLYVRLHSDYVWYTFLQQSVTQFTRSNISLCIMPDCSERLGAFHFIAMKVVFSGVFSDYRHSILLVEYITVSIYVAEWGDWATIIHNFMDAPPVPSPPPSQPPVPPYSPGYVHCDTTCTHFAWYSNANEHELGTFSDIIAEHPDIVQESPCAFMNGTCASVFTDTHNNASFNILCKDENYNSCL